MNKAEFLQKVFNYEKNATKWVYEGDKPCIIDFYADWCGPCKMMGPVVEKCAEAYAGKMKIGKLNVDENMSIAQKCGPCKQVAPILRDLAILYKNDIVVYKVNVDKEKELAAAFGIQSIPTFLFIPKEGQPQISMGALPREEFVKQIDTFLLKKK